MSMIYYAEAFADEFPIGSTLTKAEFTSWLENKGVLEPVENEYDSNEVMGYEQNVQRLRNQINYVASSLERAYRIDILERNQSLIVRNIKDAIIHDSNTYVRRMAKQMRNKMERVEFMIYSAGQERWTNRERQELMDHYKWIVDDLESITDRMERMEKRRKERAELED